tara:strand:- start:981 stop:1319 length:339 start_codon:yes stop_codon:yes gene_type:complete
MTLANLIEDMTREASPHWDADDRALLAARIDAIKALQKSLGAMLKEDQATAVANGFAEHKVSSVRTAPKVSDFETLAQNGHSDLSKLELRGIAKMFALFAKTGTRNTFRWID